MYYPGPGSPDIFEARMQSLSPDELKGARIAY